MRVGRIASRRPPAFTPTYTGDVAAAVATRSIATRASAAALRRSRSLASRPRFFERFADTLVALRVWQAGAGIPRAPLSRDTAIIIVGGLRAERQRARAVPRHRPAAPARRRPSRRTSPPRGDKV